MINWTAERIANLSNDRVKTLLENATKRQNADIITWCQIELVKRKPIRSLKTSVKSESRSGQVVLGFHFVCDREQGITRNGDGTLWTGTWVVDKRHAERGVEMGSYVALHEARSELSYLQGIIKSWRSTPRQSEYAEGRLVQIEVGIDFLLELTSESRKWIGGGSGEKGYAWADATP